MVVGSKCAGDGYIFFINAFVLLALHLRDLHIILLLQATIMTRDAVMIIAPKTTETTAMITKTEKRKDEKMKINRREKE